MVNQAITCFFLLQMKIEIYPQEKAEPQKPNQSISCNHPVFGDYSNLSRIIPNTKFTAKCICIYPNV